jgi:hypothetical protein
VKRQAKKVRNRVPITTHVAGNAIVMRAWYSKVSVPQHTDDVSMLSKDALVPPGKREANRAP